MSIKEIINEICEVAVKNNLCTVAMGGLSLYEVNFQQNNQYPLLFVTPSQNYTIKNNIITYNIYLYYIDRLLRNNDNNIDVVSYSSTKLQSLVNLIKKFDDVLSVNTDYQVYNFADTQRLTDNVGGSYMTLSLTVKNDLASCTDSDIEGIIINKDDLQIITYTVTENGDYLITPDSKYKGIAEVNLTVDVPNVGDCAEEIENAYNEGYNNGSTDGYGIGYNDGNIDGINTGIQQQKDKLSSINITENGTYTNEDGYNEVTVEVEIPEMPNILDEYTIIDNGTYTPEYYGADAVRDVIVNLPLDEIREESRIEGYSDGYNTGKEDGINIGIQEQKSKLTSINITENNIYTNEDGYNLIKVNVPQEVVENSKEFDITDNGTYTVTPSDGYTVLKEVNIDVNIDYTEELNTSYTNGYNTGKEDGISEQKSKLTSITINNNGTYTNEDGYDEVIVEVSGGGSAVPRIPNGISLANSTFEEFNFAQNDWSGVVDFAGMFSSCQNLKYIHNFPANDEYVSLRSCFNQCSNLKSIEFPPLKVVNLYHTFDSCGTLTEIKGLENWDVSKCVDMEVLFQNCRSLTSLNLTGWYFPYITKLKMFNGCSKLTSLDLSNWDTSKITDMSSVFYQCYLLTEIKGIETWDTSNVTTMNSMFYYCSSLTSLDLSNWNLENVTDMKSMFNMGAESNLTEIKMGGRINSNVKVDLMFAGLSNNSNGKFYYPSEYADDYVKIIEKLPSNWQAISY